MCKRCIPAKNSKTTTSGARERKRQTLRARGGGRHRPSGVRAGAWRGAGTALRSLGAGSAPKRAECTERPNYVYTASSGRHTHRRRRDLLLVRLRENGVCCRRCIASFITLTVVEVCNPSVLRIPVLSTDKCPLQRPRSSIPRALRPRGGCAPVRPPPPPSLLSARAAARSNTGRWSACTGQTS